MRASNRQELLFQIPLKFTLMLKKVKNSRKKMSLLLTQLLVDVVFSIQTVTLNVFEEKNERNSIVCGALDGLSFTFSQRRYDQSVACLCKVFGPRYGK